MGKSLQNLIRLGKWHLDEKRRALTALHEREDQAIETLRLMDAELITERAAAEADALGAGLTFGSFYDRHLQRREALQRQLEALRAEIEIARDELAETYRQLKTYETAEANRLRRQREEMERREQATLDEIGLNLHRRRQLA